MAAWLQERDSKINICNNFLAGNCEFDRNCRFSHDAEAFLAQKPKELQGQCPFSAAPRCPFGKSLLAKNYLRSIGSQVTLTPATVPSVTHSSCKTAASGAVDAGIACLFASTHGNLDENTLKLLQAHQAALAASNADTAPSEVQNSAVAAADATVHSEVPSGPNIELADKHTNGFADSTAQVCQEAVSAQVSGIHGSALPSPSSIDII